ncbi:hypothetical protein ZWY2020_030892 [Hordeum vulgare]|nr:hypothetical protein ZWY2020_030892 [Hordeum vulgare]
MGADVENPDAGDYVAVTPTSTVPLVEHDDWFNRLFYWLIILIVVIYIHYMLVKFDAENPETFAVAHLCGLLLYSCSILVSYKCFSPKRTGAEVQNADAGEYVAVTRMLPKQELSKWIHGLIFCYSLALIIYVDYKLVKHDPAGLRTIVVIELCYVIVSCGISSLIYKSFPARNSKLLPEHSEVL